jgi:hypothetical protein
MQQDGQQQPQQQQLDPAGGKAAEYGEAVRWSFVQLLQEHYIERAPPCNLPPPQPVSVAPKKTKKAAPKPGKRVQCCSCVCSCPSSCGWLSSSRALLAALTGCAISPTRWIF